MKVKLKETGVLFATGIFEGVESYRKIVNHC